MSMFNVVSGNQAIGNSLFSQSPNAPEPERVRDAGSFLQRLDPANAEALMVAGFSLLSGQDVGTAGLQALGHPAHAVSYYSLGKLLRRAVSQLLL